jgi:hypothetical protein
MTPLTEYVNPENGLSLTDGDADQPANAFGAQRGSAFSSASTV